MILPDANRLPTRPLHDLRACQSVQPFVKEMLEIWSNFRDRSQLHLEHHVVQRLLGRVLAQGFIPGETPGIVEPDVEAPRAIESTEHQRSWRRNSGSQLGATIV